MRVQHRLFWLGAIALLLVAAGLRFHLLGAQSFWNDEGNAYVQATRSLTEIAEHAGRDIHPPGYYWLLALWRGLVGESEFALRMLSALASVLTVAFAYAIGRRLYGGIAGITAALLTTANTFNIYYAQEARMYALLALWAAASVWALTHFLSKPDRRWALALSLLNAAGLWTQYAYPFVMLAQGAVFLVRSTEYRVLSAEKRSAEYQVLSTGKDNTSSDSSLITHHSSLISDSVLSTQHSARLYVLANLLTIILFLPWLPTAWQQITTWPNTGDGSPPVEALGVTLRWLAFGISAEAPLALVGVLILFGLMIRRRAALWRSVLPALWVLIPLLIFLAAGMYRPDNVKLLLPAQIGMALWIGRGVWMLWTLNPRYRLRPFPLPALPRIAAALSLLWVAGVSAAGIAPLYTDPAYQRADYRGIVATIEASLRPGDAIILNAPNQVEVFGYYYRGGAPVYTLPPGLGGDDAETRAAVEDVIENHERAFVVFWGETERDPNRIVETTLDARAFEVGDTWYSDVRLSRYVMPGELTIGRDDETPFGASIVLDGYRLNVTTLVPGDVIQAQLEWRADEPLTTRYKVFLQLLDANGVLVAQRDSEPGGGLSLTTTWTPGETVIDNHALVIPPNTTPGLYHLIVGMYDIDDPAARLPVAGSDALILAEITVE